MDAATALAELTDMLAAGSPPVLNPTQLGRLVTYAQRADKYGRYPTDPNWLPTYDLHSAAREGWLWKAAQLTLNVDVSSDGTSVHRSQAYDHAMLMAEHHRRRIRSGSVRVQGQTADLFDRAQAVFDTAVLGN